MTKVIRFISMNLILAFALVVVVHFPKQQIYFYAAAATLTENTHEVHEHAHDDDLSHEHEHSHGPGEPVHSHEHNHTNQFSGFDLKLYGGAAELILSHLKTSTRFFIAQHSLRCQDFLQGIFRPPIV